MEFGFKQPLVGEKRCVTTLITAAEETRFTGTLLMVSNSTDIHPTPEGTKPRDHVISS